MLLNSPLSYGFLNLISFEFSPVNHALYEKWGKRLYLFIISLLHISFLPNSCLWIVSWNSGYLFQFTHSSVLMLKHTQYKCHIKNTTWQATSRWINESIHTQGEEFLAIIFTCHSTWILEKSIVLMTKFPEMVRYK